MTTTSDTDFGTECHEAFTAHCATLASINPTQQGQRNANARRRADLIRYVDEVLDCYLEWLTVAPLDFAVNMDALDHIERGTD